MPSTARPQIYIEGLQWKQGSSDKQCSQYVSCFAVVLPFVLLSTVTDLKQSSAGWCKEKATQIIN